MFDAIAPFRDFHVSRHADVPAGAHSWSQALSGGRASPLRVFSIDWVCATRSAGPDTGGSPGCRGSDSRSELDVSQPGVSQRQVALILRQITPASVGNRSVAVDGAPTASLAKTQACYAARRTCARIRAWHAISSRGSAEDQRRNNPLSLFLISSSALFLNARPARPATSTRTTGACAEPVTLTGSVTRP